MPLNLTPWRVQLARTRSALHAGLHQAAFTEFEELHGDRLFADDRAMVGGFAKLGEHRVVVIGTKKVVTPRKTSCATSARRIRKVIEGAPLDATGGQVWPAGRHLDRHLPARIRASGAEERHIAEAIAVNLREMTMMEVPIIATVIGEGLGWRVRNRRGGSGVDHGKRLLLRHPVRKDARQFFGRIGPLQPKLPRRSRSPPNICSISNWWTKSSPNPRRRAHQSGRHGGNLKATLTKHLAELMAMTGAERLKKRYEKFRAHGHFLERAATPAEKAGPKGRAKTHRAATTAVGA